MGHTILHVIVYIWIFVSAGFALSAKWTGMKTLVEKCY